MTNYPNVQGKPVGERLEDFQDMMAFPYCSQREDQYDNQKQSVVKPVASQYILSETKAKGNGSWYILEKLRNENEGKVLGERLYRVKNGRTTSVVISLPPRSED